MSRLREKKNRSNLIRRKWRTPLILIFTTILLFLMVSQEEVYNDLLFYVGALGTGIPIVLKLLSFFDSGGRKQV